MIYCWALTSNSTICLPAFKRRKKALLFFACRYFWHKEHQLGWKRGGLCFEVHARTVKKNTQECSFFGVVVVRLPKLSSPHAYLRNDATHRRFSSNPFWGRRGCIDVTLFLRGEEAIWTKCLHGVLFFCSVFISFPAVSIAFSPLGTHLVISYTGNILKLSWSFPSHCRVHTWSSSSLFHGARVFLLTCWTNSKPKWSESSDIARMFWDEIKLHVWGKLDLTFSLGTFPLKWYTRWAYRKVKNLEKTIIFVDGDQTSTKYGCYRAAR